MTLAVWAAWSGGRLFFRKTMFSRPSLPVPDVNRVLHEFAGPVFGLVVDQLEVEEPRQVEDDGGDDDQRDEVERRLKTEFILVMVPRHFSGRHLFLTNSSGLP